MNKEKELFDVWIRKYIKEWGDDFVFGFYVILEGTDEMLSITDPKYHEWFKIKEQEFLNETEGR